MQKDSLRVTGAMGFSLRQTCFILLLAALSTGAASAQTTSPHTSSPTQSDFEKAVRQFSEKYGVARTSPSQPQVHSHEDGEWCAVHHGNGGGAAQQAAFEQWIKTKIKENKQIGKRKNEVVITIPIVVHVMHFGEEIGAGYNIPYSQIESQIKVLNDAFRFRGRFKEIANPYFADVLADSRIEFAPVLVGPEGNLLPEPGVNRVSFDSIGLDWATNSGLNSVQTDQFVKPATVWDTHRYFNCWVMPLAGGLLGYAQFPGVSGLEGMPFDAQLAATDGIVCNTRGFGVAGTEGDIPLSPPFHLGGVAVHEVGHWLGLRHLWGDGDCSVDDFVEDTPPQGQNTPFTCYPLGEEPLSCNGVDPVMFQNFMDYSSTECMSVFTKGQVDRMIAVMENAPRRKELLRSNVLTPSFNKRGLLISEVAAAGDAFDSLNYVELANEAGTEFSLAGLQLTLYPNGDTSQAKAFTWNLDGSSSLAPGERYLFADQPFKAEWGSSFEGRQPSAFDSLFEFDGNDLLVLFDTATKQIIDQYGQDGVDGSGTFWDYAGKVATRKTFVVEGNQGGFNAATFEEWELTEADNGALTPFVHEATAPSHDAVLLNILVPARNAAYRFCEGEALFPTLMLTNYGTANLNSPIIGLQLSPAAGGGAISKSITLEGLTVAPNEVATVDLLDYAEEAGLLVTTAGRYTLQATISTNSGQSDPISANNALEVSFEVLPLGEKVTVSGVSGISTTTNTSFLVLLAPTTDYDDVYAGINQGVGLLDFYQIDPPDEPGQAFEATYCLPRECYTLLYIANNNEGYTITDSQGNVLGSSEISISQEDFEALGLGVHPTCLPLANYSASVNQVLTPKAGLLLCEQDFVPAFDVLNLGATPIDSLLIGYKLEGETFERKVVLNEPLLTGQLAAVELDTVLSMQEGAYAFEADVVKANETDMGMVATAFDAQPDSFYIGQGESSLLQIEFVKRFGDAPATARFHVVDDRDSLIFSSEPGLGLYGTQLCLPEGCYRLRIDADTAYDDSNSTPYQYRVSLIADANKQLQALNYFGRQLSTELLCLPTLSVAEIILESDRHSILAEVIKSQGSAMLEYFYSPSYNSTLFAPTDSAFEAYLAAKGLSDISQISNKDLEYLLWYHQVSSIFSESTLAQLGQLRSYRTANIFLSSGAQGLLVNGNSVDTADMFGYNGVVHSLNGVLESNTLWDLVREDPSLDTMQIILEGANLGDDLSGEAVYTFFAPIDGSYEAGRFLSKLNTFEGRMVLEQEMRSLLNPNRLPTDQLNDGDVLTMLNAVELNIQVVNGQIKISQAPIVEGDLAAYNGIVHKTQGVPESRRIPALLAETERFSLFAEALQRTGVALLLDAVANATVFVPNNIAFTQSLHELGYAEMTEMPPDLLREMVMFHVLPGYQEAADLAAATSQTWHKGKLVTSKAGEQPLMAHPLGNPEGMATAITEDIIASNGLIHELDKGLIPNSLFDIAWQKGLNPFLALINRAGLADSLKLQQPLTVLAPQSIKDFDPDDRHNVPAHLDTLSDIQLLALAGMYLIPRELRMPDLADGMQLTAISGDTLTVEQVPEGMAINGIPIVEGDLKGQNGWLHILEGAFETEPIPADQAPSDLVVSEVGQTSAKLTWTDNSDQELGFKVSLAEANNPYETNRVIAVLPADTEMFTVTDLAPNTLYLMSVHAFNTHHSVATSNLVHFRTLVPIPDPPVFQLQVMSHQAINVYWDWLPNVERYRIEYGKNENGPFSGWADFYMPLGSFTAPALDPSTTYYFRMFAYNEFGKSDPSDTVSATTFALPLPGVVTGLSAQAASATQIVLDWDDLELEEGYRVEMANNAGGPFTLRTTTAADISLAVIDGLQATTEYFFRVKAFNAAGEGAPSAVVAATTTQQVTALEMEMAAAFTVFPNPAETQFSLRLDAAARFGKDFKVAVFDIAGGELLKRSWPITKNTSTITLSTKDWPAGLYTIRLTGEKATVHRKILIGR